MTYTIRNHPGGYDIYKDGECLSAEGVVERLEAAGKKVREELEDLIHTHLGPECNIEAAAKAIISAGWRKQP